MAETNEADEFGPGGMYDPSSNPLQDDGDHEWASEEEKRDQEDLELGIDIEVPDYGELYDLYMAH